MGKYDSAFEQIGFQTAFQNIYVFENQGLTVVFKQKFLEEFLGKEYQITPRCKISTDDKK